MKEIQTLIPDIYALFGSGHEVNRTELNEFAEDLKASIIRAFEAPEDKSGLRLSKAGTPLRKLWFDANRESSGPMSGQQLFKFLIGHVTEALLLYLAKEAGHSVQYPQETVFIEEVEGHIDSVIDGHLVDVKTASHYAIEKFRGDALVQGNDPFGYLAQLSAYKDGLKDKGVHLKEPSFFWAYNKSDSEMFLTKIAEESILDSKALIRAQKETLTRSEPPPEKCYEDEPYLKSGNRKLGKNCHWCAHKFECWKDANDGKGLREFAYAKGPLYFTKIVSEPKVKEE